MIDILGGSAIDGNITDLDPATIQAADGRHLYAFDANGNKTNYLVEATQKAGGLALGSGNFANPAPAFDQTPEHNQTANRNAVGAHDEIYSRRISDITGLLDSQLVSSLADEQTVFVTSYRQGWAAENKKPTGGGHFVWDSDGDKSSHDGGLIIDPDLSFPTLGDESGVREWFIPTASGQGVWRRVVGAKIEDDMYGVYATPSYSYNEAFWNRYAYDTMLNNEDNNSFLFKQKPENVYIWGSVNIGRGNLHIEHERGCNIIGRYSDPSETASGQAGHLFGFVKYADPYPNNDYSLIGSVDKVSYQLDGEASTEFNAGHTQQNNNNVIAFYDSDDSSVYGSGGIPASDHNGIAFDGISKNPKVDVAYIRNYYNRAVTFKGDSSTESTGSINVGEITGKLTGGTVSESILVDGFESVDVTIGKAVLNGTVFVSSRDCGEVVIDFGYLENALFICGFDDTEVVKVTGGSFSDVTYLLRRGGTSPESRPLRELHLEGIKSKSAGDCALYISQISPNLGDWDLFKVHDCNFESITGTLTSYIGRNSSNDPDVYDFKNNKMGTGWVYDSLIYNESPSRPNAVVGSSSFSYDIKGANNDNPYKKITIILTHSSDSNRYKIDLDLKDLLLTAAGYVVSCKALDGSDIFVTTSRVGTDITFSSSASAGVASISSYSLSN